MEDVVGAVSVLLECPQGCNITAQSMIASLNIMLWLRCISTSAGQQPLQCRAMFHHAQANFEGTLLQRLLMIAID